MKLSVLGLALFVLGTSAPIAAAASWQTPYQLIDNRIVVPVAIDGVSGFSMILDTGASGMSITPQAARRLHLSLEKAGSTGGAGAGRLPVWNTRLKRVGLAGVAFGTLPSVVLDLGFIQRAIGFAKLDGIVGYDVLRRYAVEINADRKVLTLLSGRYRIPANGRIVGYAVRSNFITLPARINSARGDVILDTGDRSSLTVFAPFAHHYGFYSVVPSIRNAVTGYGIGGTIRSNVFRTRLSVFGYTVNGVLTRAPVGAAGVFDSAGPAGTVGNGFLLRFNIIYDLPRERLVLWPNTRFSAYERYDPAGMWIGVGAYGPLVTSVLAGGPADKAGVRAGDTILSVDRISTRTWLPPQLRTWLKDRPAGTAVTMLLQSRTGVRVSRMVRVHELI